MGDQTAWCDQIDGSYGFVKVNEERSTEVNPKTINISFLIHITEDGLVQAYAKNGSTTRWHVISSFKVMQKYLNEKTNIPMSCYMHILDNSTVTRNKEFFD